MISLIGKAANKHKKRCGFTLIELAAVTVMVSVLTALATPMFKQSLADLYAKDLSFNLMQCINFCHEAAVIERVNYELHFDFEKALFWISKSGETEPIREGRVFSLPRGMQLSGDRESIAFYPDGRSDEGEIRVIDAEGRGTLLRVNGIGSEARIYDIGKG